MSSVARGGPSTMPVADLGVGALSAAAAAHQMSRLGEAFKDSLAHHMQMGSSKPGSMPSSAVGPYGVSVPPQYMPQATSSTGSSHSDRLYGGSAFSHGGNSSMGSSSSLNEKSSPRSSRGSVGDAGSYGLSVPSPRGSIQLPAPSVSQTSQPTQLGGSGAAHQAAVSLSHIAGGGVHQSQPQAAASQPQTAAPGRTAASMNPKGTSFPSTVVRFFVLATRPLHQQPYLSENIFHSRQIAKSKQDRKNRFDSNPSMSIPRPPAVFC
jgi:hypothetical protein